MKRILTFLICCTLLPFHILAQEIWTEGTTWECYKTDSLGNIYHHITYKLEDPVNIDGTKYYALICINDYWQTTSTQGYLRSEQNDMLVYGRVFDETGTLSSEQLIYDFTKPFQLGDSIRYGTDIGIKTTYLDPEQPELFEYYYDVLGNGDDLPAWDGLLYMVGHIEGPLYYFDTLGTLGEGDKPKKTNVSHVLFGTKGKNQSEYVPMQIEIIRVDEGVDYAVSISGQKIDEIKAQKLFIYQGKKYMLIER